MGEALEASNGSGKELSCVQHIARRPSAFSRPTSYTSREMRAHVAFPDSESAALSRSAWWVKHEGRMDGDARECEIAACASVGAEIQTCIQDRVRAWRFEAERGRRNWAFHFYVCSLRYLNCVRLRPQKVLLGSIARGGQTYCAASKKWSARDQTYSAASEKWSVTALLLGRR